MLTKTKVFISCLTVFILVAGIVTFLLFSNDSFFNTQVVKSSTSDMTMQFPKSWVSGPRSEDASISMASKDASLAILTLEEAVENFEQDMTLEAYSDKLIESMKTVEGATDWEIGDIKEVTIGRNTEGLQRTFTVKMDSLTLTYLQTVFKTDALFIEILAWSVPDNFDSGRKVFDKLIARVTPPTNPAAPADEGGEQQTEEGGDQAPDGDAAEATETPAEPNPDDQVIR